VEFLRSSLERARCEALFHTGAADVHRQAMTSVRLQVASVRNVLMDAISACDQSCLGIDVRERIGTALSMLKVDTLGEHPVFKPHSSTALFVKRQRSDGSMRLVLMCYSPQCMMSPLTFVFARNCQNSAHSFPMPWKKRVLLHMEPTHFNDESSAAIVTSSLATSSDAVTADTACESGDAMKDTKDTKISQQIDESANECVPPSVCGVPFHLAEETPQAEGFDSMVS
jgi:hypothetical protein